MVTAADMEAWPLLLVTCVLAVHSAGGAPGQHSKDLDAAPQLLPADHVLKGMQFLFWRTILTTRDDEASDAITITTTISSSNSTNSTALSEDEETYVDPWSLVWYIGSFGGLVTFFLVISCTDCCCKRRRAAAAATAAAATAAAAAAAASAPSDPPPPPYEMFAPPPYESLVYAEKLDRLQIFVVPLAPTPPPSPAPPQPPPPT